MTIARSGQSFGLLLIVAARHGGVGHTGQAIPFATEET